MICICMCTCIYVTSITLNSNGFTGRRHNIHDGDCKDWCIIEIQPDSSNVMYAYLYIYIYICMGPIYIYSQNHIPSIGFDYDVVYIIHV